MSAKFTLADATTQTMNIYIKFSSCVSVAEDILDTLLDMSGDPDIDPELEESGLYLKCTVTISLDVLIGILRFR